MSSQVEIGGEIAGYRIESVIGRGGMGVVYLAEHLRLKRKVALKVLAPELARDERFRERFLVEAELAASLDHPNVVPVFDTGEAEGLLYIAMRFVEGTDLKTLIEREGPLELERAGSLVFQVAAALDAAHAKGLIHRDVKPANVLLDRDDHAYLTDFGLTKRPDQTTGLTRTGQFMGSVDYAAPEQFEGKPLDGRTDVYSLGCVAYESLTGEVPFRSEHEAAVMSAHLRDLPPAPSAIRPELGPRVDDAVRRAMAKVPGDRQASAGTFAKELQGALRPAVTLPIPGARAAIPRRALVVGAASVLVLVGLVGGILAARGGGKGTPGTSTTSGPPASPPPFAGVIELDSNGRRQGAPLPIDLVHSDTLFEKQIAVGDGFVWTGDATADKVSKINPGSRTVVFTVSVGKPLGFAFAGGGVWISQGSPVSGYQSIVRIDPTTNSVTARIDVGSTCCGGVAYAAGSVWILSGGSLTRMDPDTETIEKVIDLGGNRLVTGAGMLWVLDSVSGSLVEVDPNRGRIVRHVSLSGSPTDVAIGFRAAWVTDSGGTVARIPLNGQGGTDTIPVGKFPNDVDIGDGAVWVANAGDGTVSMISEAGGSATSFRVGGFPTHLAVGEGGVWVLVEGELPNALSS